LVLLGHSAVAAPVPPTLVSTLKSDDIISKGPWLDFRASINGQPGAVVGGADCGAQFIRAVNYLSAKGGGDLIMPAGAWYFDNSVGGFTVPPNVNIHGASYGPGGTELHFTSSTHDDLIMGNDGYGNHWGGIHNVKIIGGARGVVATAVGHFALERVFINGTYVVGLYLNQVLLCNIDVVSSYNLGDGALIEFTGQSASDHNKFLHLETNFNGGAGTTKRHGQGNTFLSFKSVGNAKWNLRLEGDTSNTVPLITSSRQDNDVMVAPYIEGNYVNYTLDTWPDSVEIVGTNNTKLENGTYIAYVTKSSGVFNIKQASNVDITGTFYDFNFSGKNANVVVIDNLSLNPKIDISAGVISAKPKSVFGARFDTTQQLNPSVSLLSNSAFQTNGAGGADVFAAWTESGNGAGQITADTTDTVLFGTTQSAKVAQPSTAAAIEMGQLTTSLTAGATYYVNLTYKCDTGLAHSNSPIQLGLQNAGDSYKSLNFLTGNYDNTGLTRLWLPISSVPYSISIPFVAPPAGGSVWMRVIFDINGSDTNNAIYHVYEASVSTSPNSPFTPTGIMPVASGGTGSSNGSIAGTGALTFAAGGSNQNINLTPSGTGRTVLNGTGGVNGSSPTSQWVIRPQTGSVNSATEMHSTQTDNTASISNIWQFDNTAANGAAAAWSIENGATIEGQFRHDTGQYTRFGTRTALPACIFTNGLNNRLCAGSTGIITAFGPVATTMGANVASANSVTPTGQTFHLTGTTTVNSIANIFWGASGDGANGCINIIADGAVPFGISGNISRALTLTTGQLYHLCYDANLTKWFY